MATDRTSTFQLVFDGEAGTLKSVLAGLKSQMRSDVAELESITSKVDLFKGLQTGSTAALAAVAAAKAKVDELTASVASVKAASGTGLGALQKDLALAQKALNSATTQSDRQQASLAKLDAQLKAAGVNTASLATEEVRLATALQIANAAATNQAAQQVLGLRTLKDVTPQISQLYAAYNTLSVSGSLSMKELALAQAQLQGKVADLKNSVTGVADAAKAGGPDLVNFFQRSILPALGITATIGGAVAGIRDAVEAASEFSHGLAEIGTVTNLSKDQLDALGTGARALAIELGVDVNDALKGLFDLIRSGIPPENALTVLRTSAEAAKAGLTDVGTGVTVARLLIDSFGISLDQLPSAFDKITKGTHDYGVTLSQFAASAGPLLNVARAAGVSFDDLIATLTVLTSKSGDVEKSIGDLSKIIAKLDTTATRDKLRELGITGTSLVDIFQQIGAKGLSLQGVLGLGLTGAGIKSAASLATLTNNAKLLPGELDAITHAGGDVAKTLNALSGTNVEKMQLLSAATHDFSLQWGLLLAQAAPLVVGATAVINTLNKMPPSYDAFNLAQNRAALSGTIADNAVSRFIATLFGVAPAAAPAKTALDATAVAAQAAAAGIAAASAASGKAANDLKDFGAQLTSDIKAIQDASTSGIADATTRADAEIALLDKSAKATAATAAATLVIQTKLNADKLALITKSEQDITAAVDKEVAARTAIAQKEGIDEAKIATVAAQTRVAALGPVLAQYQSLYAQLITEEQGYASKVNAIDQERLNFNESIEKKLFDIRIAGLSAFDQYVAKVNEVENLVSLARQAGLNNDLAGAKKYTDEALALTDTITKAVDANGTEVVSAFDVQQTKIKLTKEIADEYNTSLSKSADAAKAGADATKQSLTEVAAKLTDLQGQYDGLKKTIAEGLEIKVALDETSVANALSTLNDLTRPRTIDVTVRMHQDGSALPQGASDGSGITGGFAPDSGNTGDNTSQGFAKGGWVAPPSRIRECGRQILSPTPYAFGGPVFSGAKVPGSGNQDTFPAMLKEGSFVVRKGASTHYGDAIMGKIAHFATGGSVPQSGQPTTSTSSPASLGAFGDYTGGFQSYGPPTIPTNFADKVKAVFGYIAQVRSQIAIDRPGSWDNVLTAMNQAIDFFGKSPTDTNLNSVLDLARQIGLNLGYSVNVKAGFDVDGRRFHPIPAKPFGSLPHSIGGEDYFDYEFYAKGGRASSDTMPAMLTPGEYVMSEPAVGRISSMFGGGFLPALNAMQIPKIDFGALMAPPAGPRHFADGGPVGYTPRVSYAGASLPPQSIAVTVNASAASLLSRENVNRFIVPVLEDAMRKSRT